jgi:hypothetical protein
MDEYGARAVHTAALDADANTLTLRTDEPRSDGSAGLSQTLSLRLTAARDGIAHAEFRASVAGEEVAVRGCSDVRAEREEGYPSTLPEEGPFTVFQQLQWIDENLTGFYLREVEFSGATAEGSFEPDPRWQPRDIPAGAACLVRFGLAFDPRSIQPHVSVTVPDASSFYSGGELALRLTDFTADDHRVSWTVTAHRDRDVMEWQSAHSSWFDSNVNALSLVEETEYFGDGYAVRREIETIYVGLTADRSGVRDVRYTQSRDGQQVAVVDCVGFAKNTHQ